MKRRRFLKKAAAVGLAAAMALAMAACSNTGSGTGSGSGSSGESASSGSADASVLNVGYDREPNSFDPAEFNSFACDFAGYDCYNRLMKFTADGTDVEPDIAESYEMVDDTTYTYKIRQDVTFWDGNPMTMDDVLYSMNRVMNPDENYSMSYLFSTVDSFEADNDNWTLTVHLKQPDSTWKYVPATTPCIIVEKAVCEQYGEEYGSTPETTMGSGPYKLDSWEKGSEISFVKNDSYWNKDTNIPYDKINVYIMQDTGTIAMAAKNGTIDFAPQITNDELATYEGINYDMITCAGTTTSFLALNCQVAPFDDENVRKAVAYAIDSKAVQQSIAGDLGTDLFSDILTDTMLYQNPDKWKQAHSEMTDYTVQDYDKAKEYLAKSAYPDGLSFELYTGERGVATAELIQSMLEPVGITMNINKILSSDSYTYLYGYNQDEEGHRPYQAFCGGWTSDYLDPVGQLRTMFYSANTAPGCANQAMWTNSDFDALIDQTYLTTDDDARTDLFIQAAKIENDACAYIPFYTSKDACAMNPAKGSLELSPQWFWNFTYTDFKPAE